MFVTYYYYYLHSVLIYTVIEKWASSRMHTNR